MAAIDLNLNPSRKQLQQFGVVAMLAVPVIGWYVSGKPTPTTWQPNHTYGMGSFVVAGIGLGMAAWLRPSLLKWIFIALSVLTFPIGFVLGEIILSCVYAIAFVPLALVFRMTRRDALARTLDRDATTYWQPKMPPKDASSYYRQS